MEDRLISMRSLLGSSLKGNAASAASFLLTVAAYLAVYAVLDAISFVQAFEGLGLGISLWTPAMGLSLALLLARGLVYAPLIFLAVFVTDLYVHDLPRSASSIIVTAAIVTLGYAALAWAMQRLGFDLKRARLRDIVILLIAVPSGIAVISLVYCTALYLMAVLPEDQFLRAAKHFWVGDTVGTVIVVPAVMAAFAAVRHGDQRDQTIVLDLAVFLAGLSGAFWIIFSPERANELQFFYLLFLPMMWIAIRMGFVGAALGLLLTQGVLVAITKVESYQVADFMAFQMLMLALSATGLLLGAVVTERGEAEERLREQQAELSRMSRYATAGIMGLSIAHQISQPLSTVATYLHAVRRLSASERSDSAAIADALRKAEAEAQRAREVLERIRDFLSGGRLELVPVDLVGLASRIALIARAEGAARGVQIHSEGVAPVIVQADPIQLEQVLVNLIGNAVDAAAERPDGKGAVRVCIARDQGTAKVVVEDNGPGIAPEIAERLLEPFETTKTKGMGLGLPLSKHIIECHGATLRWLSLQPQGTKFIVEFNVDRPQ